ncbi:MAG: TonB family protein, partial [Halothiobacillaceae bacterium]|nr:TonB family protein [Halothiobacillaceae bacterium]
PEPAPPANGAPAAPASAPTPPAKPSAAQQQDLLAAYQAALAAAIEREKFYPPLARRLNQEGIVEIGFTVLADGRIVNIHLLTQAPSAALERGAMAAIAGVGQFKPIPPQLGMGTMNLTISLVYKLR